MDEKGFKAFLKAGKRVPKGLPEKTIRSHMRMVKEFEAFLANRCPGRDFSGATERDVREFVRKLLKSKRGTFDEFIGLLRFSRFVGNVTVELILLQLLDGSNVLGALAAAAKKELGKKRYDEILGDYKPAPIGTPPRQMPKSTKEFMDRLDSNLDKETCRAILLTGPHAGPPQFYVDERAMFLKSRSVDEYLRKRREKFVKELAGYMKDGTLFFTQRIDAKALEFVKKNPEIAGGVRKGNKILLTKVPYMMIEYLAEKDKTLRRYYYCHCPLARESILHGPEMSHNLCYCSAGYEKRPFDVAFGTSVKADVLQSVLWGDPVCRFSIEIPANIMDKGRRK